MRFWIGLFISLIGGLIGVGLFREWLKLKHPEINDFHLDIISLIILGIGLIITAIDHSQQSKNLKKLEEEQKGRILKPKQKENLLKAFTNLTKTKVLLMGIQGDRESIRFANTIKDIFVENNWEVDGVWEEIIIGGVGSGLILRESSSEQSIGTHLNEIFNNNDITSRIVIKPDMKPNQIEIIVGSRP